MSRLNVVLAVCAFSSVAWGQQTSESAEEGGVEALQVEALTATGTWLGPATERQVRSYPGARTVLDEQALKQSGARTLEDALRVVPGVRVQDESGTGLLPNIGVRGLSPSRSEQVLVLVDGIPVAPAPYGQTGLSLFPVTLQTLSAVDVARGGIAVHYGPNNVGGVINLVTKAIPTEPSISARLASFIGPRWMSMNDAYVRAGGFVTERLGLQLQANAMLGDSYRVHSNTRAANVMGDAEWLASEKLTLKAKLQYYQAASDLPGGLTPEVYEQDATRSLRLTDRFEGRVLRGSTVLTRKTDSGEQSLTVFGHQGRRLFAFAAPLTAGAEPTRVSTTPRDYLVLGTELRQSVSFEALVPHQVTWGARYMAERVDYLVDNTDVKTQTLSVARDWWFRTHALAGYVSDTLSLVGGKLKVTPGVRYELLGLLYDDRLKGGGHRNTTQDVLPGLSVGYQVAQPVYVYGNYHRSFRPVQFTQVTYGNELVSERANNYELGVRLRPHRWVDVGLAYFDIRFQNKLEFVDQTVGFRNLGRARHRGLETSLGFQPSPSFDVRLGYTYLDATQRSGPYAGNALPYASPHEGTFRLAYRRGTLLGSLGGSCRSAAFADAENTVAESADGSKGEVPGSCVANVHVSEAFAVGERSVRVGVGLNNLTDTRTYTRNVDYSSGRVPAPGRTALVTLEFEG